MIAPGRLSAILRDGLLHVDDKTVRLHELIPQPLLELVRVTVLAVPDDGMGACKLGMNAVLGELAQDATPREVLTNQSYSRCAAVLGRPGRDDKTG